MGAVVYRCPICGQTVKVSVTLRVTPTCSNKKHREVVKMEVVSG